MVLWFVSFLAASVYKADGSVVVVPNSNTDYLGFPLLSLSHSLSLSLSQVLINYLDDLLLFLWCWFLFTNQLEELKRAP